MKKTLIRTLVTLVIVYVFVCLLVWLCPRLFFYNPASRPSDINNAREYDYPAQEVKYTSADGTPLFAWYTAPQNGKKMVVFMHGNSHNIEEFYHKLKSFAYEGFGTFIPEYRGFGGLKGNISQKNLEADAQAAVRQLNRMGYKNEDIYVYGMSLGSHMATHTVYEMQKDGIFAGLILEVPFDSLLNTARRTVPFLPLSVLMRDKYDNVAEIKEVKSPILIMGGSIDPTVPVDLAVNLYNEAPAAKKMIIYKNGKHSNLFNFRNDLDIINWMEMNEKSIY